MQQTTVIESSFPNIFGLDEIERLTPDNEIVRHPARRPQAFDPDPRHPLERDFSRVLHSIVVLWGTEMCTDYIRSLVMMKPGEKRQGFPMELLEDLLMLDGCNTRLMGSALDAELR